jgi:serine/threonine protein kinase
VPAPTTIAEFLELGQKSGLLDKTGLDTYVERKRASDTLPDAPGSLAKAMVRDGLLTTFQADLLLKGKWKGFIIAGKYRLLACLGVGGMGTVFLCEHTIMRRRVAVKVLPAARLEDPAGLERFHREARAAAALDHPNIVHAHDVGFDGKIHFLVMEYIDGISMEEAVKKGGPLDIPRAARYVAGAARGLQHAHEAGLVHRDIKPANLLVDRSDTIKILDMGLARFFKDDDDLLTREHDSGTVLGTVDFLAPEQATNSHDVDIRADIYSLGVTFYYLLTRTTPFADGSVYQKLVSHLMREPKPIRDLRPEVPEELAVIIAKMMAKDRDARYQTPAEVVAALAPWVQSAAAPLVPEGGRASTPTLDEMILRDPAPTVRTPSSQAVTPASSPRAAPRPTGPSAEPVPVVAARRTAERRPAPERKPPSGRTVPVSVVGRRRWPLVAAGVVVGGLVLLAVGVFIATRGGSGTLEVQIDSPTIQLTVTGEGQETVLSGAQPRQEVRLPPGQYEVQVGKGDRLVKVSPERFLLKPGERLALRAWREAPVAQATQAAPQPAPSAGRPAALPGVHVLEGHTAQIEGVAFSPDGKRALSCGHDRTLRLWDVPGRRLVRTIEGHSGPVWNVAFLPDGRRAVSCSSDRTLRLWDLESGTELRRYEGHTDEVRALALAQDGHRLLSGGLDKSLRLWDVESGEQVRSLHGHEKGIWDVALAPDGRRALSGGMDRTLRLWDVESGEQLSEFHGHTGEVRRVTFSPDGKRALSCAFDMTMRLWEADSGRELRKFDGQPYYVESVSFSPGGRYGLTSEGFTTSTDPSVTGDRGIRLWELETGAVWYRRGGVPDKVLHTVFSPDGRYALSACDDKVVRLWELPRLPDSKQGKGRAN